ncbi:MAG: beta-lactamase family protein [Hyphomonas sp.]|nr:beta-lactamase family protein [Hyphomonas sp.]
MVFNRLLSYWHRAVAAAGAAALSSCITAETASSSRSEQDGLSGAVSSAIDRAVDDQIRDGEIPGALVMIARGGDTAYYRANGFADIENNVPIARDTIFRFYSMTKPITCATVMTLYDDGLIGLDDPIKDYLPELSSMKVRTADGVVPATKDITIRNLMTHTSGFSYAVLPGAVQQDYIDADVFAIQNRLSESLEDHVKRLAGLPLVAEPGTIWNYGESMGVLGRLVEVVSGSSFRDYMKERVLTPLSMDDTDFFVPSTKRNRLAALYHMDHERTLTNANDDDLYGGSYLEKPRLEYGGAGLVGTADDYMKFAQMLLQKGQAGNRRILSAEAVRLMTTNQLDDSYGAAPLAASGRGPGVGFGFCGLVNVESQGDGAPGAAGEYGWSGWASTNFWIDPQNDLAALVFTQVIPDDIGSVALGNNIRKALYADESNLQK